MKRVLLVLVALVAGLFVLVWGFNFWGGQRIHEAAPTAPPAHRR